MVGAVHCIYKGWLHSYKLQSANSTFIETVHFISKRRPVDLSCSHLKRSEHVEDMHLTVHDKCLESTFQFAMNKTTIFRTEGRCHDGLSELCRFVRCITFQAN